MELTRTYLWDLNLRFHQSRDISAGNHHIALLFRSFCSFHCFFQHFRPSTERCRYWMLVSWSGDLKPTYERRFYEEYVPLAAMLDVSLKLVPQDHLRVKLMEWVINLFLKGSGQFSTIF